MPDPVQSQKEMLTELSPMEHLLLQHEVEQFLYKEADLLDRRLYQDWLNLLTDDIYYWMPIRRTTTGRNTDSEFTKMGDMAFFDDNKDFLEMRIKKISAGNAWSEDPPSRTRHFVSNVKITSVTDTEITLDLNFHLYRTRLDSVEDSWLGRREDKLRRVDGQLMLAQRYIFLEQTLILAQNMSSIF
ncbi:MAG TPA: 3-phenylpropionate/cinnamic acid dioxygenase subunit beta [Gammaproteobacteria bacterium]|nr:3-phenylpropionate/cinnamic acid dioxygenase subunit beta [Gammaproteobacteria bacterium]HIK69475.1 3-phenylpropionate/cinnamic acid dioxygenase subunit beta [Pseudomonadales bacterium]|tara:strand:- start:256 stop:813 length:558 start_codon:yes stop_codon:yes gene_type:complete